MNDVTKETLPFDATHEMVDGKWVEKAKPEAVPEVAETSGTPVVI